MEVFGGVHKWFPRGRLGVSSGSESRPTSRYHDDILGGDKVNIPILEFVAISVICNSALYFLKPKIFPITTKRLHTAIRWMADGFYLKISMFRFAINKSHRGNTYHDISIYLPPLQDTLKRGGVNSWGRGQQLGGSDGFDTDGKERATAAGCYITPSQKQSLFRRQPTNLQNAHSDEPETIAAPPPRPHSTPQTDIQ